MLHRAIHKLYFKAIWCNEKAICEHNPEMLLSSVRQHFLFVCLFFLITEALKWRTVLWGDKLKCEMFWRKWAKIASGPSSLLSTLSSKACISFGSYRISSLHIWKGSLNAEGYIEFWEQYVLPCRGPFFFFAKLCTCEEDSGKPHATSITTARLHSRRIWVLYWSDCSPDLSPTLAHHESKSYNKEDPGLLSS